MILVFKVPVTVTVLTLAVVVPCNVKIISMQKHTRSRTGFRRDSHLQMPEQLVIQVA